MGSRAGLNRPARRRRSCARLGRSVHDAPGTIGLHAGGSVAGLGGTADIDRALIVAAILPILPVLPVGLHITRYRLSAGCVGLCRAAGVGLGCRAGRIGLPRTVGRRGIARVRGAVGVRLLSIAGVRRAIGTRLGPIATGRGAVVGARRRRIGGGRVIVAAIGWRIEGRERDAEGEGQGDVIVVVVVVVVVTVVLPSSFLSSVFWVCLALSRAPGRSASLMRSA